MKIDYKYKFVTETVYVELDEDWGNMVIDMDRIEYNNNHKETRRHTSMNYNNYENSLSTQDITEYENDNTDISEELFSAINKLTPKQKAAITAIYFNNISVTEYAKKKGITKGAVSHILAKAKEDIKKFLKK